MRTWDREIRQKREGLDTHLTIIKGILAAKEISGADRRTLELLVANLEPDLEEHLCREEQVLFPALLRMLNGESEMLTLLQERHEELRKQLKNFKTLAADSEASSKEELAKVGRGFVDLLQDHEDKEERFLLDMLDYCLEPKELDKLAKQFSKVS